EDALGVIIRQKNLNFEPGSQWLYSNTGFFLLSVVVKRVSGQSLPEFAAANMFKPLGMSQTLYRDQHSSIVPGRALAYDTNEHGGSWGGYRAQLLRFPDQHFSVACLCNLANANPERRALRVADILLASEMKGPIPAADAEEHERKKKETVPVAADQLASYA